LIFLDLDRFKEVNDTLGHDIGDLLLQDAARRLTSCVRESDTVARLGGDEFTLILRGLDDPSSVERIVNNILQKMAEPFHLKNKLAYVSASIGITIYPKDGNDIDTLIKNADQSMYASKDLGRNRRS
jgi:diguanylate cyclase (GGDEF)-like protein